jgi:alginate O-acetyltransferase complex protein AlgI
MLFNTYEFFLIFLPVVFVGYFYLTSKRLIVGSKVWLVSSSLFFYSWWDVHYLPLLLLSMFINFGIGTALIDVDTKHILRSKKAPIKRVLIFIGIAFNLGFLGYFKYTDFLLDNFNGIFGADVPLPNIILPLAISFFTFQQIAYLVDSYRSETKEYDLLSYMLFVSFFPQLIAGPIVHHKEMMPQFASVRNMTKQYRNILLGLSIFTIGLFKKVVIADSFAVWSTEGFDHSQSLNFFQAWATSLSYSMQLYFDFSGYVDMAIGVALLFNIRLPSNFNSPYKAKDIQDFWRRWHMTLSRFLRDYVYIPLGGNRNSNILTYRNLFLTFLLGGIWHGAGWGFVIWGVLHGLAVVVNRLWKSFGIKINGWMAWFITFNFVNLAWVFFRAKDFDDAIKVIRGMLSFSEILPSLKTEVFIMPDINVVLLLIVTSIALYYGDIINTNKKLMNTKRSVFVVSTLFFICLLKINSTEVSEFLYFEF